MSWEAVSAIGQLIGAVGVIASIAYLAVQIRQNTSAVRGASEFDAMQQYATLNDYLLQSPELLEFAIKMMSPALTVATLSDAEISRGGMLGRVLLQRIQAHFHLYRNGLVAEEGWQNYRSWTRGFLEAPFYAQWWKGERTQGLYTQAFIDDIERAPVARVNIAGFDRFASPAGGE